MIYLGGMNPTRLPRLFVFLSLLLILAAFLLGTLLSFTQVQAAPAATPGGTGADEETSPTATLTPEPGRGSANMTGILLLGIVLVMIILFGLLWGGRITHK
jgi:hypothetical protein